MVVNSFAYLYDFVGNKTQVTEASGAVTNWQYDAVNQLKTTTLADADEYRMLVNAREHLESGRDYRSIRAGGIRTV